MAFSGHKVLGVSLALSEADSEQKHELGLRVTTPDGGEFVYVEANGAISAQNAVRVESGFVVAATGTSEPIFGVAHHAFSDGEFGFVQTRGEVEVDAVTGLAADTEIDTATDGTTAGAVASGSGGGVSVVAEASGTATVNLR